MTWQPIETAPLDGTLILIYCPGGISIAPWPPGPEMPRAKRIKMAKIGEWPDHHMWSPTHWMPLPEPPNA